MHKLFPYILYQLIFLKDKMRGITIFFLTVLTVFISCKKDSKTVLSVPILQANLDNYVELCWNKKNIKNDLKTLVSTDFKRSLNGINVVQNAQEMKAHINLYTTAFPDLKVSIIKSTFHKQKVFVLWSFSGTNTGNYGEIPATGKKVTVSGSSTIQFNDNGSLSSEVTYYNELDLLQQLGYELIPPSLE